jgi:hypothetical protein
MRFDFHPTASGWRVSEVNSDVPGGWSEGTSLPLLYQHFYSDLHRPESPLSAWGKAIQPLAGDGHVALLCAPGYLEDEQVVRTFMRELQSRRTRCIIIRTPASFQWNPRHGCTARESGVRISAVIRFYQAEWLCALPERTGWKQLLRSTEIPFINPTISALSESKRFALTFKQARVCPTWKALVPECRDPRDVDPSDWDRWVLKACYSNTGDKVYICGNLSRKEQQRVIREAHAGRSGGSRKSGLRPVRSTPVAGSSIRASECSS